MTSALRIYIQFCRCASYLQLAVLLAIRFYWGWQFAQYGWGKLHHIDKITDFFTSLNIPFPAANAHFISGPEFSGMMVVYRTADHNARVAIFSDPGKFYGADLYTFLFASLMVLIFGAGLFPVDALLQKRLEGVNA